MWLTVDSLRGRPHAVDGVGLKRDDIALCGFSMNIYHIT